MQYWKIADENRFVLASTLNADGEGNSTKEEYDEIAELYRNAPDGYGVMETSDGFEYAPFPAPPEQDLTDEEALEIILGGAT